MDIQKIASTGTAIAVVGTGAVVPTTKAPQIDYRNNVPQR